MNQKFIFKSNATEATKAIDFLINSSFQRVNRLVLSFEDSSGRRSYKR